ncbi:MAG TPA: SRPBCC family protein [Burkholderiaceae bacterium]|nr:SRPBCC family protein [Burkholderiaceae bacterium]
MKPDAPTQEQAPTMLLLRIAHEIAAPADRAWDIAGDFERVDRWIPEVKCTVEGRGIGARRTLTYPDGRWVCERFDRFEPVAMLIGYSIVGGGVMPLQDLRVVLQLRQGHRDGVTVVDCVATARAQEHPALPQIISGFAARALGGIEQLRIRAST